MHYVILGRRLESLKAKTTQCVSHLGYGERELSSRLDLRKMAKCGRQVKL